MVFNIGAQRADTINNVAGDQTFIGGSGAQVVVVDDARYALNQLRQQLQRIELSEDTAADVQKELDRACEQLSTSRPDKRTVARSLQRLTQLLRDVGALAAAGHAVIGPLGALARWLGELGRPVITMLGL